MGIIDPITHELEEERKRLERPSTTIIPEDQQIPSPLEVFSEDPSRSFDIDSIAENSSSIATMANLMLQDEAGDDYTDGWHLDPDMLKMFTNNIDTIITVKEHKTNTEETEAARVQNEQDITTATEVIGMLDAEEEWANGNYEHVFSLIEELWGTDAWERFVKEHAPEEGEGEGSTLDMMYNNISVLKNAIGRWIRYTDPSLAKPSFLLSQTEISENAQVIIDDTIAKDKRGDLLTGAGDEYTLEELKTLIETAFSEENIPDLYLQDADMAALSPERANLLRDIGKALPIFRSEIAKLEIRSAEKKALEQRYTKLMRNIPMSEHRSRALMRVYKNVLDIEGALNPSDFDITEVELNESIDDIVMRAAQGEWDHDTNITIMKSYSKSFANFKEASDNNRFVEMAQSGRDQDGLSSTAIVSSKGTMRYGLLTGEGAQWGDLARHIKKVGWENIDSRVQEEVLAGVNEINEEANNMFIANFGDMGGDIRLINIEDIKRGTWGLNYKDMDPIQFWISGVSFISDLSKNKYEATPLYISAFGEELIQRIQRVEQKYGEGSIISSDQLRKDPEAVADIMMVLGILANLNRLSGEMGGEGKKILEKIFTRVADDPFTQGYIRTVSLALNENLQGEKLFGIKLPELMFHLSQGQEFVDVPVLDDNGKPKLDESGKPIVEQLDLGGVLDLMTTTMTKTTKDLIDGLYQLVNETELGQLWKVGGSIAPAMSRTTRGAGGMNRVGTFGKDGYFVDKEDQTDLDTLMILYRDPDAEDSDRQNHWTKQWNNLPEPMRAILDNSLIDGGDASLARDHDKMIALLNVYLNNASTRGVIEALSMNNILSGDKMTVARLLTTTNTLLGGLNVTAVPAGLDESGGLMSIKFMPGKIDLTGVDLPKGSINGADKARTITDQSYHINWMPAWQRTTGNFATFTENDVQGVAIPQQSINNMNETTFNNMVATFGEAVLAGIGYNPNTEEGKAAFMRDVMTSMWQDEARSWGGKQQDWRPRSVLDFSIGALERLLKHDLKLQAQPSWYEKTGLFFEEYPLGEYGRIMGKVRAEFILEDGISVPLGGREPSKDDTPRIRLFMMGPDNVERSLDFNWRIDQSEVDYYHYTQDEIARIDAEDQYLNWFHGPRMELSVPVMNRVGKMTGLIDRWGPTGTEEKSYKAEDLFAEADMLEFKMAISIERYKFYHNNELPHWWNIGSGGGLPYHLLEKTMEGVAEGMRHYHP